MASNAHLHETFDVPRGPQRFRELILYVSKKCEDDPNFGAVKLNKVLYYSDFRAFQRLGIPITGVRYQKLQQGPAPKSLLHVRRALVEEGALQIDVVDLPLGYEQHRTVALREPVLSLFTEDEIQIVDEVIREFWNQTAAQVSDASHDIRWNVMQLKDPMPYELAHLEDGEITEEEHIRTTALAKTFGW